MNTLDKILSMLKEQKKTGKELAAYIGLNQQAVTSWKSGQSSSYKKYLPEIAKFFSVPVGALLDDPSEDEISNAFITRPVEKQGLRPILGSISAGLGTYVDEQVIGWEAVAGRFDSDEYFYLLVDGDSMSPLINDGDLLLIRRQDSVDSGDIGAFLVDGEEGFVKKVKYDTDYITFISLNPVYEPITFVGEDVLRVRVVGKVVEMKRKF